MRRRRGIPPSPRRPRTRSPRRDGEADVFASARAPLAEEGRRRGEGRAGAEIPVRSDRGRLVADDIGKERINPDYSCVGRSKGLAELRGVTRAVAWPESRERADRG
jgi:mannonate dehydratase